MMRKIHANSKLCSKSVRFCTSLCEGKSSNIQPEVGSTAKDSKYAENDSASRDENVPTAKAKRLRIYEERYDDTSYYQEKGLRKVYPYHFTFNTVCKERWIGRTLLDIFLTEFRLRPVEEYIRIVNSGEITVNNKRTDVNYKFQNGDFVSSLVHRHEAPVANWPIEILHESDDLVVVNKPSSVPVHPCGRYRYNTVLFILAKDFNLKHLKPSHRLDKPTSGVLLFGKNKEIAWKLSREMANRQVTKEYISRVVGEFPTGKVSCEEPIEILCHKLGIQRVGPNGKRCVTVFERLSYNGKTSIVLCKPQTGRTHQIRVHLQYLGFPIVHDSFYNHPAFGPERGKGGITNKTKEEVIEGLLEDFQPKKFSKLDRKEGHSVMNAKQQKILLIDDLGIVNVHPTSNQFVLGLSEKTAAHLSPISEESTSKLPPFDSTKFKTDSNCFECNGFRRDPNPDDLFLDLHAWRYQGSNWKFESKLPKWIYEN